MRIPCTDKFRLLDVMNAHAIAYSNAVSRMAESIGTSTQGEYFQMRLDIAERRQLLDIAKQQFQAHKEEHGC